MNFGRFIHFASLKLHLYNNVVLCHATLTAVVHPGHYYVKGIFPSRIFTLVKESVKILSKFLCLVIYLNRDEGTAFSNRAVFVLAHFLLILDCKTLTNTSGSYYCSRCVNLLSVIPCVCRRKVRSRNYCIRSLIIRQKAIVH